MTSLRRYDSGQCPLWITSDSPPETQIASLLRASQRRVVRLSYLRRQVSTAFIPSPSSRGTKCQSDLIRVRVHILPIELAKRHLTTSYQRKPVPRLRFLAFPRRSVGTSKQTGHATQRDCVGLKPYSRQTAWVSEPLHPHYGTSRCPKMLLMMSSDVISSASASNVTITRWRNISNPTARMSSGTT